MICADCHEGGRFNQAANEPEGYEAADMLRIAQQFHRACKGGNWCDCQHRTGLILNNTSNGVGKL